MTPRSNSVAVDTSHGCRRVFPKSPAPTPSSWSYSPLRMRWRRSSKIEVPEAACTSPVVVAIVRDAAENVRLEPFEALVGDEVDDTADRVGTVGGRRAAGHHVDTLDQQLREQADVGTPVTLAPTTRWPSSKVSVRIGRGHAARRS